MVSSRALVAADEVPRIERVRGKMRDALVEVGIELPGVDAAPCDTEQRADPFDQSLTRFHYWRDSHNNILGSIQLHGCGRVFAEYDVLRNHPHKPGWFIESVSVWGDDSHLRSELQLLPLPD